MVQRLRVAGTGHSISIEGSRAVTNDKISTGYYIGQIHVRFLIPQNAVPIIFPATIKPPKHLTYIEWFTRFPLTPDPNHGMFKISCFVQSDERVITVGNVMVALDYQNSPSCKTLASWLTQTQFQAMGMMVIMLASWFIQTQFQATAMEIWYDPDPSSTIIEEDSIFIRLTMAYVTSRIMESFKTADVLVRVKITQRSSSHVLSSGDEDDQRRHLPVPA
ncbi:hypothetical protein BDR04DRAFT_1121350 [Suillus decipiens]|nr:hypothetical protein BDR04DRAFT_1121350 [Suillus decipiens]